jgi:hypothetical protein
MNLFVDAFSVSLIMFLVSKGHVAILTLVGRTKVPQSIYSIHHNVKGFS